MITLNLTTIRMIENQILANSSTVEITFRLLLLSLLTLTGFFGNGSILVLLKRFRTLHTIPNILIANVAAIDLLNVVINVPLTALLQGDIREMNDIVRGRVVSALVASLQTAFILLNVFGMTLMMLDRLAVIKWGLRYKILMSTNKALLAVAIVWLLCITIMIPWFMNLHSVDLGDALTLIYRMVYYHKVSLYITGIRTAFAGVFVLLAFSTWYILRTTTRELEKEMSIKKTNLRIREARRRTEAHAAITVAITVGAYVLSCVPLIIYYFITAGLTNLAASKFLKWFAFFANNCQFVSSMCNPFIYMARCNRFNRALKQFFRDPCGSSEPHESGVGNSRLRTGHPCREKSSGSEQTMSTSVTKDEQVNLGLNTDDMIISFHNPSSQVSPVVSIKAYRNRDETVEIGKKKQWLI